MKLTQFQLQEFSKYWFDLSKLVIVSFVIKFFEPGEPGFSLNSAKLTIPGLTVAIFLVILGLIFARGVKK